VGRERLGRDAWQHDDDQATAVGGVASLRHVTSVPAATDDRSMPKAVALHRAEPDGEGVGLVAKCRARLYASAALPSSPLSNARWATAW
jgi:hypothetical protein